MKRILEGSQKSLLTVSLMAAFLTLSACGSDDDDIGSGVGDNVVAPVDGDTDGDGVADGDADGDTGGDGDTGADGDADAGGDGVAGTPAGGVFVMSNILDGNTIVSYARADDGTLSLVGEFSTGGIGGDFDGGEGLDPLISAYAIINSPDNEYLMAVNAGSGTVSVMQINPDMSLELVDTESTSGVGPNSIAFNDGLVYVSNIDADGNFDGEPDQEGSITGFTFADGDLTPIEASTRLLPNRPAAIRFSPDGNFVLTTSINAGSNALASGNNDELIAFSIGEDGVPSGNPVGSATSTQVGNAEGRNLASAIGFEVVDRSNGTFAIVTEAREFTAAGDPPNFPGLQTGSVSVFQLNADGSLADSQLDLLAGQSADVGQRTACWIVMSPDGEFFWVSNAVDASISTYRFTDDSGNVELVEELAAIGTQPTSPDPAVAFSTTDGFIDLDISDDGAFLYQLYGLAGVVGVYAVEGGALTLVEEVSGDLPPQDTQGIVSF